MANIVKLACALVLCMVVVAPHAEAAITSCGPVTSKLAQCLGYLKGGPGPSVPCCQGLSALKGLATTPADRKEVCTCLKSASGTIPGIRPGAASSLASKCGVSVPYAISPSTDCSKVN